MNPEPSYIIRNVSSPEFSCYLSRPFLLEGSVSYLVEHLEGGEEFLVGEELFLVHGGDDELGVVDEAGAVDVDGVEHLQHVLLVHRFPEEIFVAVEDLLLRQLSVPVLVDRLEDLRHVLLLVLGEELGGDEGEGGLLELLVGAEVLEVGEGAHGDGGVDGDGAHLGDPGVLQDELGRGALLGVEREQLRDQVLGLLGDLRPARVREGELTHPHLLHDLLVARTVEGRHPRQDDVEDHAARPDVALLVVLLVQNLGCDVVRGAEFLVEGLVGVVLEGGTEVNDLDLIEVLVLLQKDILGLQVSIGRRKISLIRGCSEKLVEEVWLAMKAGG